MNKNLINNKIKILEKKGFVTLPLDKKYLKDFKKLKMDIQSYSKKRLKCKNFSFENFHNYTLKNIELNNYRLNIINLINSKEKLKNIIYLSIKDFLDKCLGPDIIVQKNINLTIQKPNDKNRSPFHKDGPVASNFELVIWIPLVHCKKTMSLYLFEITKHEQAKKILIKNLNDSKVKSFSKKSGKLLDVKFGEVLIFSTNVFHYIPVNQEKKTRWSLNLRYKNLFTQYGTKNLLDYYEILKTSPVTKLLNKIETI
tara:strand:- start:1529 stop:2293 length:765 start_codon:yes stop_codon:yes gene_type:complete